MIGNGLTHPYIQYASWYTVVCTNETGTGPYVPAEECEIMAATLPECQALVKRCAENLEDAALCLSALLYCETTQADPYYATGRSPYDMEKFDNFEELDWVATWLNQEETMHKLGVDKASHGRVKGNTGCDRMVKYKFLVTGDL